MKNWLRNVSGRSGWSRTTEAAMRGETAPALAVTRFENAISLENSGRGRTRK
jgi:hypothetical protein